MNAIVVVDENWAIGRNGGLLMHLPGDLKYFRQKTEGRHIVVGRKTLDSFPGGRPLPERENIVLTGNREYENPGCTVCYSLAQLMMVLGRIPEEEIFICGGASIYAQMMNFCDIFYVTRIMAAVDGADRFFEDLDAREDLRMTWKSDIIEENGTRYYFAKYER